MTIYGSSSFGVEVKIVESYGAHCDDRGNEFTLVTVRPVNGGNDWFELAELLPADGGDVEITEAVAVARRRHLDRDQLDQVLEFLFGREDA